MRVVSWNVNGLRSVDRSGGFRRWIDRSGADIIGVQEVRARTEQLPRRLTSPKGWHTHLVAAEKKGYSGVGLFSKVPFDRVETSLGIDRFDSEGRVQIAFFKKMVVANVYFPNGNGKNRDNSRVPYKLEFYQTLHARLKALENEGYRILVMGDFNTAHTPMDLARPKSNYNKTSGFLEVECQELSRWIDTGYTDTFRSFNPDAEGHYTWWSQRQGARERNVGWRIDYVFANRAAKKYVDEAFIWKRVRGSDHCPLGVDLDNRVLSK